MPDLCCGYNKGVCCVRTYMVTAVLAIQVRTHVCIKNILTVLY